MGFGFNRLSVGGTPGIVGRLRARMPTFPHGLLCGLSIRVRVILLALVATAGLSAIAADFSYSRQRMDAAFAAAKTYSELAGLARNVMVNAMQMRRFEKDFLLSHDTLLTHDHDGYAARTQAALELVRESKAAADLAERIDEAMRGVAENEAVFREVVALQKELGLGLNDGLNGRLNAAAEEVEHIVDQVRADNLYVEIDPVLIRLQEMRLHEGHYMRTGGPEEIKKFDEIAAGMDGLIDVLLVPDITKARLKAAFSDYAVTFGQWVEGKRALEAKVTRLNSLFETLPPILQGITVSAEINQQEAADELAAVRASFERNIYLGIAVIAAVVVWLCYMIGRSITGPVHNLTGAMRALAAGDTTAEVPETEDRNEIGEMARALRVFKDNAIERAHMAAEQQRRRDTEVERSRRIEASIGTFQEGLRGALGGLGGAAGKLENVSATLSSNASHVTERTAIAGNAIGQACADVDTVASAAEELAQSINQIAAEAAKSTEVAGRAVSEAGKTTQTMRGLSAAADRIGEVVGLIQDIAEQTNLLALTATIEAARAGDAGRGFAVVAGEVKALATQTAKATEEISTQIKEIQSTAGDAAKAITTVDDVIEEMSRIAALVADAVEEQNAVIGQITETVGRAASRSRSGVETMSEVDHAAEETGETADQVKALAAALTEQANALRANVDRFLSEVRVA
ncbi:MAG TPA: methyl-accepting chemotaxis protein [Hyphomicrobiales bacterium]|nr:methyl-accepting chemotaxis protein [Hyphomicrobiales bacterium]